MNSLELAKHKITSVPHGFCMLCVLKVIAKNISKTNICRLYNRKNKWMNDILSGN